MADQMDAWNPEWDARTPAFGKRLMRGVLRDLAVLTILLGGLETLLHTVGYGEHRRVGHVTGVGTDRFGYREKQFALKDQNEQFRVLAIGDSTTFGTGVRWNETYAKQLQALLAERCARPDFLVLNAGGQGSSFKAVIENLEEHCNRVSPDVVVLAISASFPARHKRDGVLNAAANHESRNRQTIAAFLAETRLGLSALHRWSLFNVRIWDFVQHEIRYSCFKAGVLKEDLESPRGYVFGYAFEAGSRADQRLRQVKKIYRAMEEDLVRARDMLKERAIPLCVMALPSRFMISNLPVDNFRHVDKDKIRIDPVKQWQVIARRHGIPFVDVKSRLLEQRQAMVQGLRPWDDLYVPDDIVHLNAAGNRIASEAIADEFYRRGIIPVRVAASSRDTMR